MTLPDLASRWREEAAQLERRGLVQPATQLRSCAEELAEALRLAELEELPVSAAAAESGYSESRLRRLFPGRKTIPRANLPKKPAHTDGPDLASTVLNGRESA